ncbi:MAG: alpha-1,4-glucan--maltose-1-phosphate maltosyltransferase [candidate division NC10 bacterium]|nr:alpha-1,4-glucan--maltose-1-phosphate maltosyltransferase [candidate division NC10 bacterium]
MRAEQGRGRVIIEGVKPEIDGGRFPIKRTVGERVIVEADIFAEGHDVLAGVLRYRHEANPEWSETPLEFVVNDRWRAAFAVTRLGRYHYCLEAWVDRFKTWRRDLRKKVDAGQDGAIDLLVGAELIEATSRRSSGPDATTLRERAAALRSDRPSDPSGRIRVALADDLALLVARYPDRRFATTYGKELHVVVDQERARFSTWYEMFPRSCAPEPGVHGTFKDCEERLPYVAEMGFDVLYFPPIHPIGRTHRKGKNNSPVAGPDDPGSPWAIGSGEGGHKAVHPQLGTLDDFRRLLAKARAYGIEIALDIAFQCSPDHPYVKEHPESFRWRPDGTIQYAENPPKKYEDIYPFEFETEDWQQLWDELRSIVLFWIDQGVRIFRVDNPHTKPFRFWAWVIDTIKRDHPDVIFLAEAFTRPKVMYELAKLGFAQSYTYFAWRNTKEELTQYFNELYQTEAREYFRANLWPNTPDILTDYLQSGGRTAFMIRFVLAATLGANYGIYGPAFELCEHRAREPGSEEYLDSEKYEIKHWDITRSDSLREFITRVNRIRRENPALQNNGGLRFHAVDNEQLLCFSKGTEDQANVILVVVNLSPHYTHAGWVELDLDALGLARERAYQVHDLLNNARYLWHGPRNYVELNPHTVPASIFRVRRRIRTERDFDYYL